MITIRDFKGKLYNVLEHSMEGTTLLEDVKDKSLVRIRSWGWDEIGFVRP